MALRSALSLPSLGRHRLGRARPRATNRRWRTALTTLAIVAASLIWLAPPAAACSCVVSDMTDFVERADVVVLGAPSGPDAGGPGAATGTFAGTVTYDVDVDRVYVGEEVPEQLTITSESSGAACGLESIQSGKAYLVFASGPLNKLQASLCGGTQRANDQALAELEAITASPSPPVAGRAGPPDPDRPWFAAGAAFLGGIAALVWRRRRRAAAPAE